MADTTKAPVVSTPDGPAVPTRPIQTASYDNGYPKRQEGRRGSSKRIIICCDGTWQSSDSVNETVPSNVARLCHCIADAGTNGKGEFMKQIRFYDSGVGTGELNLADKLVQGVTGAGLDDKVLEAYNFVAMNYYHGDEIFCFGFSRGAYTARAVAGLITDIGVCHPTGLPYLPRLYDLYKQHKGDKPFIESKEYYHFLHGEPDLEKMDRHEKLTKQAPVYFGGAPGMYFKHDIPYAFDQGPESRKIKAIGVWDTVGSLGVPDIGNISLKWLGDHPRFHNVRISPWVENAFHAIALDEHRAAFGPTLWYIPKDQPLAQRTLEQAKETDMERMLRINKETVQCRLDHAVCCRGWAKLAPPPNVDILPLGSDGKVASSTMVQCWFPGMHLNVGGGNTEGRDDGTGDYESIANIAFHWMLEKLSPFIAFSSKRLAMDDEALSKTLFFAATNPLPETWTDKLHDWAGFPAKERFRKLVNPEWGTGPVQDSCTGVTAIAGSALRRPGDESTMDVDGTIKKLKVLGVTNECIHPVVAWRKQAFKIGTDTYDPSALKGWNRQLRKDGKGYEWVAPKEQAGLVLQEHIIEDVFENYASRERAPFQTVNDALTWMNSVDSVTGQTRFHGKPLEPVKDGRPGED